MEMWKNAYLDNTQLQSKGPIYQPNGMLNMLTLVYKIP
jgi:hypothetical protein